MDVNKIHHLIKLPVVDNLDGNELVDGSVDQRRGNAQTV
jgi:hypothetical protein